MRTCICGLPADQRGCPHCDRPPPPNGRGGYECPPNCAPCRTRAHTCTVCRRRAPTPVAATYCDGRCRRLENAREGRK